MKKRVLVRWVLFSTAALTGLAMCGAATSLRSANAANAAASASASAAASALAAASASALLFAPVPPPKRQPPIALLETLTIPSTPSPVPTLDEWKNATVVDVSRHGYETSDCTLWLVREWLKIKCDLSIGAIYQHAGNPEGVAFWITPKPNIWSGGMEEKNGGEMIFPLRVGDRRFLQFYRLQHDGCVGVGYGPSVMVDETWVEGDPAPTVVLR